MTSPILLAEDDADNRNIFRTFLTHFGYDVIEAVDGEEALEKARAHLPSLILMDVSMPKLNGWEATRQLKEDPATQHIPIVALTAHALSSDRQKSEEVGCDGFLPKPVEPRKVLAEVQRLLGTEVPGASATPVP